MPDYKKLYAYLVGKIDDSLTLLEAFDLFQHNRAREILQEALLEAEEIVINQDGDEE